ncbi:hypothetical protein X757_12330 [Mesorhizobium sp. LSHC414A00]|nr:hypothetical protein X757_12330 [Mesorhizobium sp. LSHC414A00]
MGALRRSGGQVFAEPAAGRSKYRLSLFGIMV